MADSTNRDAFYKWLKTYLKDRGLQFSQSGFKGGADIGKHTVDTTTGSWGNPAYSSNKPPRWLFHVDVSSPTVTASLPGDAQEIGIGGSNTAQADKAGLAVRILPLLRTGPDTFERHDEFEIQAIFMFHGPLKGGSSSDAFSFMPATGVMRSLQQDDSDPEKRVKKELTYIFAGLLGLRPRTDALTTSTGTVTYGEVVDAIASALTVKLKGREPAPIAVYDLSEDAGLETLKAQLSGAWNAAGPPPQPRPTTLDSTDEGDADSSVQLLDFSQIEIPQNPDLLGVDGAVYRQINALLKSGKQHLMLYGPPGTGKTSLARWIADSLPGGDWTLITGSSDWTSQDIIGGYQPLGGGDVDFVPGILLREFDRPLIIDELNRCDIDKVIGPLFTVLSGQQTTLPYRTDISDKKSQPYVILPKPKATKEPHEFAPANSWRLIATINSIDKASLYQMSYALSRRFGWVYVDAPKNLAGFVRDFLARHAPNSPAPAANAVCPLAEVWKAINSVRVIGPAPIIDAILAMRAIDPLVEFFGPASAVARSGVLDALDMVLLPMLDGIVHQDAMTIAEATIIAFGFDAAQQAQIRARLEAVAI